MEITICPTNRSGGFKIQFQSKEDKNNFMKKFKNSDFGPDATVSDLDRERSAPQEVKTLITFTSVIKNIPTNVEVDDLKKQ